MINIRLDKCIDQDYCLDDDAIQKWFSNKYIFLRLNRIRFDFKERGPEAFIYESFGQWIPILTSA